MAYSSNYHKDNFMRCHEGLQLICSSSLPCVQSAVESWHKKKQQQLKPCQTPNICPSLKKPTNKQGACQSCINWSIAIENALYDPNKGACVCWKNINVTMAYQDPVEMAKGFTFVIPAKGKRDKFSDFDSGSILKIMQTFEPFHHSDAQIVEAVAKVSNVRNTLSHMKVTDNLNVERSELKEYFSRFTNLVDCLEKVLYLKSDEAKDIREKLDTIRTSPITTVSAGLERRFEALADAIELKMERKFEKQEELLKSFDKTSLKKTQQSSLSKFVTRWKDKVSRISRSKKDTLDHLQCQRELQWYYQNRLCRIPLYPGDLESCVNLQDIYVNLSLTLNLPKPCSRVQIPLESYKDMFTREDVSSKFIVIAGAGLGKTTLAAKMAYDWETDDSSSLLSDVRLMIIVNMRWIDHTSDIEDIILSQLLPDDTKITRKHLRHYLDQYQDNVMIVLNAFDEADRDILNHPEECGTVVKLLSGNIWRSCKVIVTSRPWRASEITGVFKEYTQLELRGFEPSNVRKYITKFFTENVNLGERLLRYAAHNYLIFSVSSVPLMALLICLFWQETNGEEIPNRMSGLYNYILYSMLEHFHAKKIDTKGSSAIDMHDIIKQLGSVAHSGLWPPENRLFFSMDDIEALVFPNVIDIARKIGIISVQPISKHQMVRAISRRPMSRAATGRSKPSSSVVFFHKSVQEKLAGDYMASLFHSQLHKLTSFLDCLRSIKDVLSVQMILRFACGANQQVAEIILTKLMQIFKSELKPLIHQYYDETLDLEASLKVQQFIELCICCIFEADVEDRLHSKLSMLFPNKTVHLLGVSSFVSVALGYFIGHAKTDIVKSVRLRPIAHAGDNIHPVGPLAKYRDDAQQGVKRLHDDNVRKICMEYLDKCPGKVHGGNIRLAEHSPASLMAYIQMWEACDRERLPKASESNLGPVLSSFEHSNLERLDIRGFKVGDRFVQLVTLIESGNLSSLLELYASNIGLYGSQMERLCASVQMTPLLRTFDIAFNEGGNCLSVLAKRLPSLKSIEKLYVSKIQASASNMKALVEELPKFSSMLTEFQITGNTLNDAVADVLATHLPLAKNLTNLWISADGLSQKVHRYFLMSIKSLTQLRTLRIFHSPYPDDFLVTIADVLKCLGSLDTLLTLTTHRDVDPKVRPSTWLQFMGVLETLTNLRNVELTHIAIDDFQGLVAMCRRLKYTRLCFSMNCLPENSTIPDDDFFLLR